ncbi:MAG: lipid II flippase MurJ [Flavitalea sp.]
MLKVESYKKGIVLSTVFNIFNKGLVFLNGLLVAYYFGVQTGTDLFFYVYNTVLILGAFFTSINGTVVIPESMRIRTQEGEANTMSFLNFFIFLYGATILIALLIIVFDPASFFSIVSNFKHTDLEINRPLLFLSLPLFGMICIINLLTDILTSNKFFTIPMIVGIINGLFSITCLVLFHDYFGIKSVLFGLLTSYAINILMLVFIMKKFLGWKFGIVKVMKDKRIWKNLGFAQLGNFTSTAASYTPIYILSGFNTGIITALTFAQQISSLPTALVTTQFSSVAGIKFNELYASHHTKEINRVFSEAANFLHFLMVPLSCFIFYFSDDIVKFLLGFTSLAPSAASYVTLFLRFLGFLLPLYVINNLISRLFMASHKIKESFWYQVLFNVILIPVLFFAVKYVGAVGYPLAIVTMYSLNIIASYFIEKHYFDFIDYKDILINLGWIILLNALISTSIYLLISNLHIQPAILKLILGSALYLAILIVLNNIFRLNNVLTEQWNTFLNRLKKKA